MIIVTGGAGFIGSNLVKGLNTLGRNNILVVDNLKNGHKFRNLVGCDYMDYMDKSEFLDHIINQTFPYKDVEIVFHQGACSSTTEWDGRYMMENNFNYSKKVLGFCETHYSPMIYASSASVYGTGREFDEDGQHEQPLNMYAYSKYLFDSYVRKTWQERDIKVIGLRYFNVYGPHESHKGAMASIALHLHEQMLDSGVLNLFRGSDNYGDGEQSRDFIHVDDVVAVNLWCMEEATESGIYNVGTGESRSFNDVARAVLTFHGKGKLKYIDFPDALKGSYQSYTRADIAALRAAGYIGKFQSLEQGMQAYLEWLTAGQGQ